MSRPRMNRSSRSLSEASVLRNQVVPLPVQDQEGPERESLAGVQGAHRLVLALEGQWMGGMGPLLTLEQALLSAGLPELARELMGSNHGLLEMREASRDLLSTPPLPGDTGALSESSESASPVEQPGGEREASPSVSPLSILRKARGTALPESLRVKLEQVLSEGSPLAESVRTRMERALNHDFSDVRVHTGSLSSQLSEQLAARAFTVGSDVVFGANAFAPGTAEGDELLLHELSHVVQSDEGRIPSATRAEEESSEALQVSQPGDTSEQEAEAEARRGMSELDHVDSDSAPSGAHADSPGPENTASNVNSSEVVVSRRADEAAARTGNGEPGQAPGTGETPAAGTGGAPASESVRLPGEPGREDAGLPATPDGSADLGTEESPYGEGGNPPISEGSAPTNSGGGAPSGGSGGAPSPAPAPPTTGARPPDGFIDYYMETHWDNVPFFQLCSQVGFPGSGPEDAFGLVDRFLPPDTSPEVRSTIQVGVGIATGLLDDYILDQVCNRLGAPGRLLRSLIDIGEDFSVYVEADDTVGQVLFGTLTVLDAILQGLGEGLEEASSTLARIETIAGALVQVPAVLATVLGPEATLAVEAAAAAILAQVEGVAILLRAGAVLCDELSAAFDVVLFVYNQVKANEAEANRDFERAAKYKDLMRSNVLDAFTDHMEACINALLMIPGAGIVKTVGVVAINLATGGPSADMFSWQGPTVRGAMGVVDTVTEELATTTWYNDLVSELPLVDMADNMRVDPEGALGDHYVNRDRLAGSGNADFVGILSGARDQTIQSLEDSYQAISGDPPEWYQKLINEIAVPPDPSYEQATSPTYWAGRVIEQIPALATFVREQTPQAIASACETIAGFLSSDLQPLADALTGIIANYKPELEEILVQFNTQLQSQTINLDRLQGMVASLQEGLDGVGSLDGTIVSIDEQASSAVERIRALHIDPSRIQLPALVPRSLVTRALSPVNGAIDSAASFLDGLRARTTEELRNGLRTVVEAIQTKLDLFREAISEGGSFRTMLEEQLAQVQSIVGRATEAFTQWDGVVVFDIGAASQFLSEVARQAREMSASQEEEEDPWPEILSSIAQPAVDAWRSRHEADVESQYSPRVPAWEIDACQQVHDQAVSTPGITEEARGEVDAALAACTALSGATGRDALYSLWSAEQRLLRAASSARA